MEEYYKQLSQMIEDNENCRKAKSVPEHDIRKIKIIYRNLAKQLHPDISPLTALEKNGIDHVVLAIPKISEKIERLKAEINRITSTDPYQYKFLLGDDELVEDKKEEIRENIDELENYINQLEAACVEIFG